MCCYCDYWTAPNRVSTSTLSNCKNQTGLIFTTALGCLRRNNPNSQWEPADREASPKGDCIVCGMATVTSWLQTPGVWSGGLAKSSSMCVQKIIMLKSVEIAVMSAVSRDLDIGYDCKRNISPFEKNLPVSTPVSTLRPSCTLFELLKQIFQGVFKGSQFDVFCWFKWDSFLTCAWQMISLTDCRGVYCWVISSILCWMTTPSVAICLWCGILNCPNRKSSSF